MNIRLQAPDRSVAAVLVRFFTPDAAPLCNYYHPSDFLKAANRCEQIIGNIARAEMYTRRQRMDISGLFWRSSRLEIADVQPFILTIVDDRFEDCHIGTLTLSTWKAQEGQLFDVAQFLTQR